ncbi:MAG TPA: Gfo/Idh/MocA family oxidoreductase [Bauldia sp.]|nr:Gfo/Idh/MocA family oxidoreductase [Bauldia sp.]
MSDSVRVGVIGSGRIARTHASAYKTVARGRLTACTDAVPEAAKAFAAENGLKVFASAEAMLAAPDIDAVIIATPNGLHAAQTIAALKAGKHVFCQKPIAMTLAEADEVVAEARRHPNAILQYGFMLRFTPPLADVRARISDGSLGNPIVSRSAIFGWEPSAKWFYDPKQGGGVILDTMVHFADLLVWLFGPVDYVHADGGPYVLDGAKEYGSADNAMVTVKHKSGVISHQYVTWTAGHGNFTFEVYGSKGEMIVDLVRSQVSAAFAKGGAGWSYPDLVWRYGYGGEQQHFVDRILGLDVKADAAADVHAGRAALDLVLAAQKALDTREIVRC